MAAYAGNTVGARLRPDSIQPPDQRFASRAIVRAGRHAESQLRAAIAVRDRVVAAYGRVLRTEEAPAAVAELPEHFAEVPLTGLAARIAALKTARAGGARG